MKLLKELLAVLVHSFVLALAAMFIAAALIFMCMSKHAQAADDAQWFMVLRYFDASGQLVARTIGLGYTSREECERRLAEILPDPEPEGIIEVGECTSDAGSILPEQYTVPVETHDRC